jgi:hypothetical protein
MSDLDPSARPSDVRRAMSGCSHGGAIRRDGAMGDTRGTLRCPFVQWAFWSLAGSGLFDLKPQAVHRLAVDPALEQPGGPPYAFGPLAGGGRHTIR